MQFQSNVKKNYLQESRQNPIKIEKNTVIQPLPINNPWLRKRRCGYLEDRFSESSLAKIPHF